MTGRDDAIEAGGRALYEDTWLPELWPAWEALHEKRREEYRHRFAVCLDAALPHLVGEPVGYGVATPLGGAVSVCATLDGAQHLRDLMSEDSESGLRVVALIPLPVVEP